MRKWQLFIFFLFFQYSCSDSERLAEPLSYAPLPPPTSNMSDQLEMPGQQGDLLDYQEATQARQEDTKTIIQKTKARKKMLHYNGFIKLATIDPHETIENLSTMILKAGGIVVNQTFRSAKFKIPIAHFNRIYIETQKLGKVVTKSLALQDLTKKSTDLKLRKKALLAAKKQFNALLRRATSAREKILILAEIEKLETQLKYIEVSLSEVYDKTMYSILSIEAVTIERHIADLSTHLPHELQWVSWLSPTDRRAFRRGDKIDSLDTPKGFVKIKEDNFLHLQSPSKTKILLTKLKNNPRGSSKFWSKTIDHHLNEKFKNITSENWSGLEILNFDSYSKQEDGYTVGVISKEKALYLMQVYFPSLKEKQKYLGIIKRAVTEWTETI